MSRKWKQLDGKEIIYTSVSTCQLHTHPHPPPTQLRTHPSTHQPLPMTPNAHPVLYPFTSPHTHPHPPHLSTNHSHPFIHPSSIQLTAHPHNPSSQPPISSSTYSVHPPGHPFTHPPAACTIPHPAHPPSSTHPSRYPPLSGPQRPNSWKLGIPCIILSHDI